MKYYSHAETALQNILFFRLPCGQFQEEICSVRIAAIVNPVSGWKTARKKWPALLNLLGPGAWGVETFWSEYPGHAELLAASARRSGYDRVLAVGGDGTLFEILNGLWWEGKGGIAQCRNGADRHRM